MSETTEIAWTDATFNPWSGCEKISAGCKFCYAAALPPSMRRGALWGPTGTRIRASASYLAQPLKWNRAAEKAGVPAHVFCASVADWAEDRDDLDPWRDDLWATVAATPWLRWQMLTKRPHVAARYGAQFAANPNAWLGVSVEDQPAALERVPWALSVPASLIFLSVEPMIGPVKLDHMDIESHPAADSLSRIGAYQVNALSGRNTDMGRPCPDVRRVGWVIIGGESGRHARPLDLAWVRNLIGQCRAAGDPVFVKQLGSVWAREHGATHPKGGDMAEWPADLRIREMP